MEKIQQNSEIQNLMKFLDKSVTNYHAVQEAVSYTHLRAHETRHDLV